jgi:hypothetical protein
VISSSECPKSITTCRSFVTVSSGVCHFGAILILPSMGRVKKNLVDEGGVGKTSGLFVYAGGSRRLL